MIFWGEEIKHFPILKTILGSCCEVKEKMLQYSTVERVQEPPAMMMVIANDSLTTFPSIQPPAQEQQYLRSHYITRTKQFSFPFYIICHHITTTQNHVNKK